METGKANTVSTRRTLMQEKLDALVRTQAMQLFRQQGLHFTCLLYTSLVVVAVLDEVIPQTDDVGQVGFCMTYGVDGCI